MAARWASSPSKFAGWRAIYPARTGSASWPRSRGMDVGNRRPSIAQPVVAGVGVLVSNSSKRPDRAWSTMTRNWSTLISMRWPKSSVMTILRTYRARSSCVIAEAWGTTDSRRRRSKPASVARDTPERAAVQRITGSPGGDPDQQGGRVAMRSLMAFATTRSTTVAKKAPWGMGLAESSTRTAAPLRGRRCVGRTMQLFTAPRS